MHIIISSRGVDLTDAIELYVNKKLNSLEKFYSGIIQADVMLGRITNHHNKGDVFFAECKLDVPGSDLFYREDAVGVYEALDALQDRLGRVLKKYKAKNHSVTKQKKRTVRKTKEYTPTKDYDEGVV